MEVDLGSWDEFENELEKLTSEKKAESGHPPEFLFRGHASSKWRLQTSLERYNDGSDFSMKEYYRTISNIKPEIETLSGSRWDMMGYVEYKTWLDLDKFYFLEFPGYEYMTHLRHHGFPSPLLDWTRSPYIAAFFAFNDFPVKEEKVSIFVYQEKPAGVKIGSSDKPYIGNLGPYVKSHRRHFLQQCQYTFCFVHKQNPYPDIYYTCHEDTFNSDEHGDQDRLIKYSIPSSERIKVLQQLDKYNLNQYSLFGSEDSLMATIATREFFLKEK